MFTTVAVTVRDRRTLLIGIHYVEVPANLTRPEAKAAELEREAGFDVLGARRWGAK